MLRIFKYFRCLDVDLKVTRGHFFDTYRGRIESIALKH